MRTEQIIEGHSYTNDPASFCWRTVEVIVEVYGKAIVRWHTDGFAAQRGQRLRTHGRCRLGTFARWASVDVTDGK